MTDIFIHPAGQDDNLGDSALRVGLINALRGPGRHLHLLLEEQTSDYVSGIPLAPGDTVYSSRKPWLAAREGVERPVFVVNAGEINPTAGQQYPHARRAAELADVTRAGGIVIAAGLGLKDPAIAGTVAFAPGLRDAALMSWRDQGSSEAAGFGGHAPDWAFSLGGSPAEWTPRRDRDLLAVTLRFDRPLPDESWFQAVRELARRTDTRIVTIAQVARDAPLAVRLAEALGGEYLVARSTRHDDLDAHVRTVFRRSLAVVTDRAHGLIIGATEGAYPLGSAADPQKIVRLLTTAGAGALTGHHDTFSERAERLDEALPTLMPAMIRARQDLSDLTVRMGEVIDGASDVNREAGRA